MDYWVSFDITEASKKAGEYFIKGLRKNITAKCPRAWSLKSPVALGDAFTNECTAGFHSVVGSIQTVDRVQGEGKWTTSIPFPGPVIC